MFVGLDIKYIKPRMAVSGKTTKRLMRSPDAREMRPVSMPKGFNLSGLSGVPGLSALSGSLSNNNGDTGGPRGGFPLLPMK